MSRLPALALGLSIALVVGCAPPIEPKFSESASSGTRPAWTREDLDAVVTYAEEDGHGPAQDTSISRHGVVVVFAETVVSYGVDPVRRVWRHDLPGEVVATALAPDGDVLLVRHRDDIGPFGRERLLLVDTARGRVSVSETVDALEESAEIRLAAEEQQVTLANGVVEVSTPPFKEPDWIVDLDEACEEGRAREVALLSHTSTVLLAHGCEGEDAAHVHALRTESGTVFWERRWEGAEPPRLHSLSSEQVTGVDEDPLTLLFGGAPSGTPCSSTRERAPYRPRSRLGPRSRSCPPIWRRRSRTRRPLRRRSFSSILCPGRGVAACTWPPHERWSTMRRLRSPSRISTRACSSTVNSWSTSASGVPVRI
ncbi:hypothetical protein [Nocardiopsis alba]